MGILIDFVWAAIAFFAFVGWFIISMVILAFVHQHRHK